MSDWNHHDAALAIPCTYCGAKAGERCVTLRSGWTAQFPHAVRTRPLIEAYSAGIEDAYDELVSDPEWYRRRRERWLRDHPEAGESRG